MAIKVLIVDDSFMIRRALARLIDKNEKMEVIAQAVNGEEAIELTKKHDPDVITMDIEMPRMNGLEAVWRIMKEAPCPIIMVSSLTEKGAEVTFRALELGALDFVPKGNLSEFGSNADFEETLLHKIFTLAPRKAGLRSFHLKNRQTAPPDFTIPGALSTANAANQSTEKVIITPKSPFLQPKPIVATRAFSQNPKFDAVLIGVSTGGPPVVQKILTSLPANFPVPILIAQHMPGNFTGFFAKRLDSICAIKVKEAVNGEAAKPGTAYVCPGGWHLRLEKKGAGFVCNVSPNPQDAAYKPTVNVLMESAANLCGKRALGLMLTGMGNDGLLGAKVLKAKGGTMLAQSEATCVVYGMPRVIIEAKLADAILDDDKIANALLDKFKA